MTLCNNDTLYLPVVNVIKQSMFYNHHVYCTNITFEYYIFNLIVLVMYYCIKMYCNSTLNAAIDMYLFLSKFIIMSE